MAGRALRVVRHRACWRLLAFAAHAQTSVFLEELTSPSCRRRSRAGKTTVLVPIGGTEQNGPHMVLGKHNVRVKALAERIAHRARQRARRAGHRVRAGRRRRSARRAHALRRHDHDSAGDVRERARMRRREACARTVSATSCSSATTAATSAASRPSRTRLDREWAKTPARAHALVDYYRVTETEYPAALAARGYSKAEIGTHAGLADTSLALAIDPKLVRAGELAAARNLDAAHGVYGDPRRATRRARAARRRCDRPPVGRRHPARITRAADARSSIRHPLTGKHFVKSSIVVASLLALSAASRPGAPFRRATARRSARRRQRRRSPPCPACRRSSIPANLYSETTAGAPERRRARRVAARLRAERPVRRRLRDRSRRRSRSSIASRSASIRSTSCRRGT